MVVETSSPSFSSNKHDRSQVFKVGMYTMCKYNGYPSLQELAKALAMDVSAHIQERYPLYGPGDEYALEQRRIICRMSRWKAGREALQAAMGGRVVYDEAILRLIATGMNALVDEHVRECNEAFAARFTD